MIKQHRLQKKFLSYALKGSSIPEFAKKSMQKAHASLHLEDKHFDQIKELLDQSLTFLSISRDLVMQVLDAVELLRGDVLCSEMKLASDLYKKASISSQSSLNTTATDHSSGTLLDALGGDEVLDVVVKKLYELLLKDPYLAPYFEKTDMKKQHLMQKKVLYFNSSSCHWCLEEKRFHYLQRKQCLKHTKSLPWMTLTLTE